MPATRQCFFIVVPDLARARGKIDSLSFKGNTAQSLAADLQAALREPALFERWKALQSDPDGVDPLLGATDPQASAVAEQADLHCDLQATTVLAHAILKHRLGLLIGSQWTLRDVHSV